MYVFKTICTSNLHFEAYNFLFNKLVCNQQPTQYYIYYSKFKSVKTYFNVKCPIQTKLNV